MFNPLTQLEMKTRHSISLFVCLLAYSMLDSNLIYAQNDSPSEHPDWNLIPNWSFEVLDTNYLGQTVCPGGGGQIYAAWKWNSAYGSVDYFNSCSNQDSPLYGTPSNLIGNQEPFEGDAYAAIASYTPFSQNAREFLVIELPKALVADKLYSASFRVSVADSMNFAVSNFGMLCGNEDTRTWSLSDFFAIKPQVESPDNVVISDKIGWTPVSGTFVAHGGERYVTIGIFHPDEDITYEQVSNYPEATFNWDVNSNYIDGVELYDMGYVGIKSITHLNTNIYPNPSQDGTVILSYSAEDGSRFIWEICDLSGHIVHSQQLSGGQGNVSLSKNLSPGLYLSSVIVDGVRYASRRLVIL